MGKKFFKYVSQNILGMIGISCYLMADTFFISVSGGADGITALNLVLPIYNLIFAIGSMLGVGAATRYTILTARKEKNGNIYLSNAVSWTLLSGLVIMLPGLLFTRKLLILLGATEEILVYAIPYTRTFLYFTIFFMWNYVIGAFVRNDGDPSLAMIATLSSNFFNIVFDYILIFPVGMGMTGAALATGCSPIVGILICSIHFFKRENHLRMEGLSFSVKKLWESCILGFSAFVSEMASGITIMVFNFLLLALGGNVAVAAYGIVANITLVGGAIFSGISLGCQPLFSESFGTGDKVAQKKYLTMAMVTAMACSGILLLILNAFASPIVSIFNSEGNSSMAAIAVTAVHIYFIGYLFSSLNVVGCGYFSAVDRPTEAFIISMARSFVLIVGCAILLAKMIGINGVWASYPVAEGLTLLIMAAIFLRKRKEG